MSQAQTDMHCMTTSRLKAKTVQTHRTWAKLCLSRAGRMEKWAGCGQREWRLFYTSPGDLPNRSATVAIDNKTIPRQLWWLLPVTTVLGRWRRKDQVFKITPTQLSSEFQARLREALSEKEGKEEKQKEVSRRGERRQKGDFKIAEKVNPEKSPSSPWW